MIWSDYSRSEFRWFAPHHSGSPNKISPYFFKDIIIKLVSSFLKAEYISNNGGNTKLKFTKKTWTYDLICLLLSRTENRRRARWTGRPSRPITMSSGFITFKQSSEKKKRNFSWNGKKWIRLLFFPWNRNRFLVSLKIFNTYLC